MPARGLLPADDLYARLEVPIDADPAAIEIAWRALLRRHHPDVAGEAALELAKRINVAHDWLSDPELRARYDAARHLAPRTAERRSPGPARGPDSPGWRDASTPSRRAPRPAAIDPAEALQRFLDRVGRLSRDELDRLALADPRPIAFVASIRRFLSPDRAAAIESVEAALRARVAPAAWADPASRDAILAYAHELILRPFLDEHLSEPFRERARERLTRAWDAAIDQPRYGPNTAAVARFVASVSTLDRESIIGLAGHPPSRSRVELPWPAGIDPAEDEGLRVSSALATRDAAEAARKDGLDRPTIGRLRRVLARTAHAIVLRHAFSAAEFAELTAAWRTVTGDPATGRADPDAPAASRPAPTVRRR